MVAVLALHGCRGHGSCAMCGVAIIVVAPCVVSWLLLQSLRHMGVTVAVLAPHGCHSRSPCTMCGVAVIVIAPHAVSWLLSLSYMWCCGRGHCATCGVAVMVIALCGHHSCGHCTAWASRSQSLCHVGVVVTVVALRGVSWLQSLRHVWHCSCYCCIACGIIVAVVASWSQSLCHIWCCSWRERTAVHPSAREVEGGRALHSKVEK